MNGAFMRMFADAMGTFLGNFLDEHDCISLTACPSRCCPWMPACNLLRAVGHPLSMCVYGLTAGQQGLC